MSDITKRLLEDHFGQMVARARQAAAMASIKFPQPNFIALKIAEEAGEVVRGAVHYAEKRMEWSEVEDEIVQLLAMLIRFVTEGDQVNGITPPARVNRAPTCGRGCPPWEIPCRIGCEHVTWDKDQNDDDCSAIRNPAVGSPPQHRDVQEKAKAAELLRRIVVPMVNERSREPGDAWDQASHALEVLLRQTP